MNKQIVIITLGLILSNIVTIAKAADIKISNTPLSALYKNVAPNIMIDFDDSTSMRWEVIPDFIADKRHPDENNHYVLPWVYGTYANDYTAQYPGIVSFNKKYPETVFLRSPKINKLFYNPAVTYTPWAGVDKDGKPFTNANPTSALDNPYNGNNASTLDLTTEQTFKSNQWNLASYLYHDDDYDLTWSPMTYFVYKGTGSDISSYKDPDNYYKIILSGSNATIYKDINATESMATLTTNAHIKDVLPNYPSNRTVGQEIQNFANWYQYYRSRVLAARGAVGKALNSIKNNHMRIGFTTIDSDDIMLKVAPFNSVTNQQQLFEKLYTFNPSASTPLRTSLQHVGYYFRTDDQPWYNTIGDKNSGQSTCRAIYNILITDGAWNGDSPDTGNIDGKSQKTITGPNDQSYTYNPNKPENTIFKDKYRNTLADVAMYYWVNDLKPDMPNNVPTNPKDPAFWQHIVTFIMGFGTTGTLDPKNYDTTKTTTSIPWPKPRADKPTTIDDLWHASINGHGQYFSASDPSALSKALADTLSDITSRQASASNLTVSTQKLTTNTHAYTATYNAKSWSGDLNSYKLSVDSQDNKIQGTLQWHASDPSLLISSNNRNIVTRNDASGAVVPFMWDQLSSTQQQELGSTNVLDYLRGNRSKEIINGGNYRNRSSFLGDIINSSPAYVDKPSNNYSYFDSSYATFTTKNKDRQPMLYVGANDGMLHAFNADNGKEVFAFIPSEVFHNLASLSLPNYIHHFFVNSTPVIQDAKYDNAWHSVLVSGLGQGGQEIFAINVTDPSKLKTPIDLSKNILWEFTQNGHPDLGYTMGKPSIIKLNDGRWAALFGNGYNNTQNTDGVDGNGKDINPDNDSTTGDAVIYLVDIKTGALIKKFDTGVGMSQDPSGHNRPNGIGTASPVDVNNDGTADLIYAGDLFGNVWKIDISTAAKIQSSTPQKIFKTCTKCDGTDNQPITTQIYVAYNSTDAAYNSTDAAYNSTDRYILLFGTGKFFELTDQDDTSTQSFYGIYDDGINTTYSTPVTRSDLLQQKVIKDTGTYRLTSTYTIKDQKGWYMDFPDSKERIITNATVSLGRVWFTTMTPPAQISCGNSSTSHLMALNYLNGAAFVDTTTFDINKDGIFDDKDLFYVDTNGDGKKDKVAASGKAFSGNIGQSSILDNIVLFNNNGKISGSIVNPAIHTISLGTQSWIELNN